MGVKVFHTLGDLEDDLRTMSREAPVVLKAVVRKNAREGNALAKGYAKVSSGKHAKKYPGTFTVGPVESFSGFGGSNITCEYGPAPRGQGLLGPILENGSRNNPAHLNLARSADVIAWTFGPNVLHAAHSLFWPDS